MNNPVLSFCIPTCDRPNELNNLLRQVIPQLVKKSSHVELIIKDDSSSNDNLEAENLFNESGLEGGYYRGLKEGLDQANIFIVTHAKGDFVWWCGDDEEIIPGAIDKVFDIINNNHISYIFMNFITHGNTSAANKDIEGVMNVNEFIEIAGTDMTLLSTGVFNRKEALKAIDVAMTYVGTHFASQPLILSAMIGQENQEQNIYFVGKPFLINHPTELTKEGLFWDGVYTFGVIYYKLLYEFSPPIERASIRKYLKRNFGHIWRGLVIDWIRRDIPAPRNRLWELKIYWSYAEYWLAFLIFMMPKKFVALALKLYKFFVKKHYMQP